MLLSNSDLLSKAEGYERDADTDLIEVADGGRDLVGAEVEAEDGPQADTRELTRQEVYLRKKEGEPLNYHIIT